MGNRRRKEVANVARLVGIITATYFVELLFAGAALRPDDSCRFVAARALDCPRGGYSPLESHPEGTYCGQTGRHQSAQDRSRKRATTQTMGDVYSRGQAQIHQSEKEFRERHGPARTRTGGCSGTRQDGLRAGEGYRGGYSTRRGHGGTQQRESLGSPLAECGTHHPEQRFPRRGYDSSWLQADREPESWSLWESKQAKDEYRQPGSLSSCTQYAACRLRFRPSWTTSSCNSSCSSSSLWRCTSRCTNVPNSTHYDLSSSSAGRPLPTVAQWSICEDEASVAPHEDGALRRSCRRAWRQQGTGWTRSNVGALTSQSNHGFRGKGCCTRRCPRFNRVWSHGLWRWNHSSGTGRRTSRRSSTSRPRGNLISAKIPMPREADTGEPCPVGPSILSPPHPMSSWCSEGSFAQLPFGFSRLQRLSSPSICGIFESDAVHQCSCTACNLGSSVSVGRSHLCERRPQSTFPIRVKGPSIFCEEPHHPTLAKVHYVGSNCALYGSTSSTRSCKLLDGLHPDVYSCVLPRPLQAPSPSSRESSSPSVLPAFQSPWAVEIGWASHHQNCLNHPLQPEVYFCVLARTTHYLSSPVEVPAILPHSATFQYPWVLDTAWVGYCLDFFAIMACTSKVLCWHYILGLSTFRLFPAEPLSTAPLGNSQNTWINHRALKKRIGSSGAFAGEFDPSYANTAILCGIIYGVIHAGYCVAVSCSVCCIALGCKTVAQFRHFHDCISGGRASLQHYCVQAYENRQQRLRNAIKARLLPYCKGLHMPEATNKAIGGLLVMCTGMHYCSAIQYSSVESQACAVGVSSMAIAFCALAGLCISPLYSGSTNASKALRQAFLGLLRARDVRIEARRCRSNNRKSSRPHARVTCAEAGYRPSRVFRAGSRLLFLAACPCLDLRVL